MIRLEHISKKFGTGQNEIVAVEDVNLTIPDGNIYGVIGFSGAGKSTLVRCINLLERPTVGRVLVDGQILTDLGGKELRETRKKIGMIFQHFNLLNSRTVFGNIAYPLHKSGATKEAIAERVRELLKLVDMEDKETAYPSQLSGGQKQRVAIARALANHPTVLLCDEATSALDPQNTSSILQLLKRLNRELNITVVIITHQMEVIKKICDRVAVMESGKVIEEGEVFSVFSNPKEAVTKEFIQTTFSLNRIQELLSTNSSLINLNGSEKIIRLSYREKYQSEALISRISRQFEVDINILFSQIEIIQNAPVGGFVAIITGAQKQVEAALQHLKEKNVNVEVILDEAS